MAFFLGTVASAHTFHPVHAANLKLTNCSALRLASVTDFCVLQNNCKQGHSKEA